MDAKPCILIVDDTPENIMLLTETLKRDYQILAANNGPRALQIASRTPPPDLILLDVVMPEMSGHEVCAALKEIPSCANVPVIFLTGSNSYIEEERGLALGAVDYITKPFHPAVVKARIHNHLELKRHRDDLEAEVVRRTGELLQATLARQLLENDLKLALKLQVSMLPKSHYDIPGGSGGEIAIHLRPARTIGGDLYDYICLGPDRLLFAVGDVSDKGVAAALFMVRVVTLLHWLASNTTDPASLLHELNKALCQDNEACMFVTLGCGIVNLRDGEVLYSSGGHEHPFLLSKNVEARLLDLEGGPALGLFEEANFPLHKMRLEPGQSLLLVSDGVTEANNQNHEEFGGERLLNLLSQLSQTSPRKVVEGCLKAVDDFTAGAEAFDDLTILVIQPFPPLEKPASVPERADHCAHWQIPNTLEGLATLTDSLRSHLESQGCSEDTIHDLDLMTEELLVNTISHGYPEGEKDLIDIHLEVNSALVRLTFRDHGRAFNPLEAGERQADQIGGWGIPLVRSLSDEVTYERVDNCNKVNLMRRQRES